ncbi:hypothetical protein AAFF_G00229310 [Aldrovandia affinis]|uniref:TLC domain-containing protein n=1 Tax=Aldrovandia affinis TaxID=143900 RepID=A0AAD7WUJ2_9TELE|nr:hypothetical protein AAFF_G00229310 [Aldrovandia affinis]
MDPISQLVFTVSLTSLLAFQGMFHGLSPWASSRISSGFWQLSRKQKIEWNSRIVSTLHAFIVGLFCFYILLFDDAVNLDPVCWFFDVLGYPKSSKPNLANGVLMAVTFFLVRIVVMPFYYGRMYSVFGTQAFDRVSRGARVAWVLSSFCLDIMNLMWMHRIGRGCFRVLHSSTRCKALVDKNGKAE